MSLSTSPHSCYIANYIHRCPFHGCTLDARTPVVPDLVYPLQAHLNVSSWYLSWPAIDLILAIVPWWTTLIHHYLPCIYTLHVSNPPQRTMDSCQRPKHAQPAFQWAKRWEQTLVTAIPPQVQLIPTRFLHILVALSDLYPLVYDPCECGKNWVSSTYMAGGHSNGKRRIHQVTIET